MSSQTLRDELADDPLARGYSTMTDSEVAADLNTTYRTRNVESVSGGEIFRITDHSEYDAISEQLYWLSCSQVDPVDPFGVMYEEAINIFGSNSTTVANIEDFRVEDITRAEELGLGEVMAYDVAKAREQLG